MHMDALAWLRCGTLNLAFHTWLEMREAAREERRSVGGNLSASEEVVERARLRARADSAEIVTLKAKVAGLEALVDDLISLTQRLNAPNCLTKLINTLPPPPPPTLDAGTMLPRHCDGYATVGKGLTSLPKFQQHVIGSRTRYLSKTCAGTSVKRTLLTPAFDPRSSRYPMSRAQRALGKSDQLSWSAL